MDNDQTILSLFGGQQAPMSSPVPTGNVKKRIQDLIMGTEPDTGGNIGSILAGRFEPDLNDTTNALLSTMAGKFSTPQSLADNRGNNYLKQLSVLGEIQKLSKGDSFDRLVNNYMSLPDEDPRKQLYKDKLNKETTVTNLFGAVPAWDAVNNRPAFAPKGELGTGAYLPPPPTGHKYGEDGQLVRTEPSVRDQMRIGKAEEAAGAAGNVNRLGNEALNVLGRYETNKAAPILGGAQQWLNVVGLADEQLVDDYEELQRISKEFGAQALQQFGGNDTDRELAIAIQSNIDPAGKTEANIRAVKRKIAAAAILEEKPAFMEEWAQKNGSLTAADVDTGETFTRAWMRHQREMWQEATASVDSPNQQSPSMNGWSIEPAN